MKSRIEANGIVRGVRQVELETDVSRDPRGWRVDILGACGLLGQSLGDLHVVSMKPGTVRGNHVHPKTREWLLVCGGTARLAWRSGQNAAIQEARVLGPEPALFEILPGVEHALKNVSDREIYLVAFRDASDQETVPCPVLLSDTK